MAVEAVEQDLGDEIAEESGVPCESFEEHAPSEIAAEAELTEEVQPETSEDAIAEEQPSVLSLKKFATSSLWKTPPVWSSRKSAEGEALKEEIHAEEANSEEIVPEATEWHDSAAHTVMDEEVQVWPSCPPYRKRARQILNRKPSLRQKLKRIQRKRSLLQKIIIAELFAFFLGMVKL